MSDNNYYVKNIDLLNEIVKFKETGIASDELGKMLLNIANHLVTKGNYNKYTWKKDMVSDSMYVCIRYLRSFNPDKSTNAFSYVTQIVNNAFKAFLKNEKNHSYIKDKCYNRSQDLFDLDEETSCDSAINYGKIGESRRCINT